MGLTAVQRKQIDEAIAPLRAEALRTDNIDEDTCIAAFNAAYAMQSLGAPEYVFCSSPWEALQRVESLAPDEDNFKDRLGDDAYICDIAHPPELRRIYTDPFMRHIAGRVDKAMEPLVDLSNVVNTALENITTRPAINTMVHQGSYSFWRLAVNSGRLEALSALGMYQPPRDYTQGRIALVTCGWTFAFERFCFISERPESFSHPELSEDGPRDRIIVRWRDGFVCDEEVWY